MWINLSPNLNPNLSPNPSPNLMSSLLNTCLLPLFSISSRIKLVMIFLFYSSLGILWSKCQVIVSERGMMWYAKTRCLVRALRERVSGPYSTRLEYWIVLQPLRIWSHNFKNTLSCDQFSTIPNFFFHEKPWKSRITKTLTIYPHPGFRDAWAGTRFDQNLP